LEVYRDPPLVFGQPPKILCYSIVSENCERSKRGFECRYSNST
jgi:hypothetical protein